MPSQPTVCIVESLNFLEERTHREGEIISRTLQLSNKPTAYVYIRTVEELRAVAQEFGGSDHRYLHLSFHGLVHKKKMVGLALSAGEILNEDLVNLLGPHLSGRRLFLSSCLAARSDLATTLLERSQCRSVLAPVSNIGFDDAAVFWTAFYHLMFKGQPNSMSNARIEEKVRICASLVNERFSLFYSKEKKSGKKVEQVTIGPLKSAR